MSSWTGKQMSSWADAAVADSNAEGDAEGDADA